MDTFTHTFTEMPDVVVVNTQDVCVVSTAGAAPLGGNLLTVRIYNQPSIDASQVNKLSLSREHVFSSSNETAVGGCVWRFILIATVGSASLTAPDAS